MKRTVALVFVGGPWTGAFSSWRGEVAPAHRTKFVYSEEDGRGRHAAAFMCASTNAGRRDRQPSYRSYCDRTPLFAKSVEAEDKKSGARTKKKKKGATNGNRGQRMRKSEIDDLVRGIGLEPVAAVISTKPSISKTKRKCKDGDDEFDPLAVLSRTPTISLRTQLDYARLGHTALRSFLPPSLVHLLHSELAPHAAAREVEAWRQKVEVQLADGKDKHQKENARSIAEGLGTAEECRDMLESLGVDSANGDLPFLQHFNSWRAENASSQLPTVRKLCLSPHLAQTASILLDAPSVRLYQDSLFHKRAGEDGWTPWHSDARMAPFDSSRMITFWIPLQRVPRSEEGGTGLSFADGSHADFALPYWNGVDSDEYRRLEGRYRSVSHHMPLEVGDATAHAGWTLHCADAPPMEGTDRRAFAVTYVDGRAEVREDALGSAKGDKEDAWSYRSWVEEVEPRAEFRHPSVPVVWPPEDKDLAS